MSRQEIIKKLEPVLDKALASAGIEIVDIEFKMEQGRLVFRVFIDTKEGVTHETCVKANDIVSPLLDSENLIREPYYLEISSPGLDRIIKKDRDFEKYAGHKVKVKVKEAVEGRKNFVGILRGVEDGQIILELDNETVRIPRNEDAKVRLIVEW